MISLQRNTPVEQRNKPVELQQSLTVFYTEIPYQNWLKYFIFFQHTISVWGLSDCDRKG